METHKAAMIKKCAETNALKKVFGISGVQSEYDYDIKNDVAVPLAMLNEAISEKIKQAKTKDELSDIFTEIPEAEKGDYLELLSQRKNELSK